MILASDVKRTNQRGQRQVRVQRPNSTIAPTIEEGHLRGNFIKVGLLEVDCEVTGRQFGAITLVQIHCSQHLEKR